MPWIFQVFLRIDCRVAKSGLSLVTRNHKRVRQCGFSMHDAHSTAAATCGSLDDHRIADSANNSPDLVQRFGQCAIRTWHAGYAGFFHRVLGADRVAHQANSLWTRADKYETAFLHAFGEIGVFGEEAVA